MLKSLSKALEYIKKKGGIYKIFDEINEQTMKENKMRKAYDTNRGNKMTKKEARMLVIELLKMINAGAKSDLNVMTDEQLLSIFKNDTSYIKQILGTKD
jgi:hypothetical protein